jgi:phosphoglycerate-specific signal transduction histidine kinase
MIVVAALDDNNGMMFNRRRQSQDKLLRKDILKECQEKHLWMNEYTLKQFSDELAPNIIADNSFLDKMDKDDYCFVEDMPLINYNDKIKKLIIYRWNRVYPADTHFDISLEGGWTQVSVIEFEGNSHELITKEVWVNEN